MPGSYQLAQRKTDRTTVVRVGAACFGDGRFSLVGGPCSIESAQQLDIVASTISRCGGAMLRGGAWKTRTSPYDFQGLGERAVALAATAASRHAVPVVIEALSEQHVSILADTVDMIQIGARNMQNIPLLQSAARTGLAVLLKRGPSATLEELLLAAEYILLQGNERVVLCERGIRGFDSQTRNVFDLGGALRLRELTHLPVIVDPSHASGRRSLVAPLTLAAAAAGLDGAIIEVHPQPDASLSDAAQAIDCATFGALAASVPRLRGALATCLPAAS